MGTPTVEGRLLAGRYLLGELLGRGAMAEVYDGVDTRLERAVAVKVMSAATASVPGARERFAGEARAAARLSHPNAVAVYDSGAEGDLSYLVMERLPGTTLADFVAAGPLPLEWTLRIGEDVLAALGAAHAAGLVHRDVKPGNILVTSDDRAKVADFGIAKTTEGSADLTATGLVLGTAAYLPPERIDGVPASAAGDLYALGVVLYEALAGRRPFTGDTPLAVAYAVRHHQPVPLAQLRPDLPAGVTAVVERAMSAEPGARYPSAEAMAEALRAAAGGKAPVAAVAPPPAPTEVLAGAAGQPPLKALAAAGRHRRALAAAAVMAAVVVALVAAGLAGSGGSPRRAATPTTLGAPPTTADPVAAALRQAAAQLRASGGGGAEAAGLLDQVAAAPVPARAAAAGVAETELASLLQAGTITSGQYQTAIAPLAAIAPVPTTTTTTTAPAPAPHAPPGHGKGDGGDHGGHGG